MSATLLRFNVCMRSISKFQHAVQSSFKYYPRTLATLSGNLCSDATATAPAQQQQQQRKVELKEPIGIDKLQKHFDNDIKNGDCVPVFKRALLHGNKIAIKDNTGEYSYRQILDGARKLSTELSAYNCGECMCAHAIDSSIQFIHLFYGCYFWLSLFGACNII